MLLSLQTTATYLIYFICLVRCVLYLFTSLFIYSLRLFDILRCW